MCGLVGLFGKITSINLETIFEDLLQIDVVRGDDSTGVAILANEKAKTKIIKGAVLPGTLIKNDKYIKAKAGTHLLMMGHNRAATIGGATDKNAHPFRAKHITLAHNGTLLPTCDLLKDSKFETDSETLANAVADEGIENVWPKLDGAATLSYWDEKERTFNLISDGKRSLYFSYNEDKDILVYASEAWMIRGVFEHNKEKLIKPEKENGPNLWYPTSNTLFSFKLKKNEVVDSTKTLKPFVYKYSGYSSTDYGRDDEWGGYYGGRYPNLFPKKENKNIIPFNARREKFKPPFPTTPTQFHEDYGHLLANKSLAKEDFLRMYKNCYMCQESVKDSYETTVLLDDTIAICKSCVYISQLHGIPLNKSNIL